MWLMKSSIGLGALWFHLNHGMWSAMQSLGLNNRVWFSRIKTLSTICSTIIILMFATVAVLFCAGYLPSDIQLALPQ